VGVLEAPGCPWPAARRLGCIAPARRDPPSLRSARPLPGRSRRTSQRHRLVRGRNRRRIVVVGAHYDTKDLPNFVGANDAASGTAVVRQLARTIKPRTVRPTLVFVFFDGEESPRGVPDSAIERYGLRGSRVAARAFRHAEAAIVLDFVGDRDLAIRRERLSNRRLWDKLRAAAASVGRAAAFPPGTQSEVVDDHVPFLRAGVPAIDLIDFDFPCWHRPCDDLSAVSPRSLDAVGETMVELLRRL
jgi:glutaminyl-peptide cyclotransferase